LPADTELVQAIAVLARAQQDAVWNRGQLSNQLRSHLMQYFPAALAAFQVRGVGLGSREARAVLAVAAEHPELARPIVPDLPDLLAEARFAARNEQAHTVGDVLLRRTRVALLAGRRLSEPGCVVPLRVAEAVGAELGWDEDRTAQEALRFAEEAAAEGIGA